jgi:hypothetical protein
MGGYFITAAKQTARHLSTSPNSRLDEKQELQLLHYLVSMRASSQTVPDGGNSNT